jgi:hypothetical protein
LKREVDFVLSCGKRLAAIKVKAGAGKPNLPGMAALVQEFEKARPLLAGPQGIPLEVFLTTPPEDWLG